MWLSLGNCVGRVAMVVVNRVMCSAHGGRHTVLWQHSSRIALTGGVKGCRSHVAVMAAHMYICVTCSTTVYCIMLFVRIPR